MRRRIIAWSLIIIFALGLYLFSNETVTLALLIAVIIALPVSIGVLRLTYKNLEVSFRETDTNTDKRSFALSLKNKGLFPIASAEAEVRCTNLRTGETDLYTVSKSIPPHGTREIKMDVIPDHAGRYELSITSLYMGDPLGICRKQVSSNEVRYMTVLPAVFDMQMVPADSAAMPENEISSGRTRGAVTGEMLGIKEYVPGDPVRNIHWKLSEKTGKLLVKELGTPVSDRLLVILDNSADIAQDPIALDTVATVYASLLHTLSVNDIQFSAAWTDPDTGEAAIRKITSNDEAREAADDYLAVPAQMPSAFQMISKEIADSRYAHVIIVSSTIPANIENIANGGKVTILMYGEANSFSDKNLTVIGFEALSYIHDTAGIEV